MHLSRRGLLSAAAILTAAAAGCRDSSADPTPSTSSSPSVSNTGTATPTTPTPTPSTPAKLTDPGRARTAVNDLIAAAGSSQVIKVDVSAELASVTVMIEDSAKTWQWEQGKISEVPSDVSEISPTSFNPDDYKFDDLARLFGLAGALSGSNSNQELQIVEYNPGQVLMVVVTRPESRPVFFRPDATPIHELVYSSVEGMTEGLTDALGGRTQLAGIGFEPAKGLWADAPDPKDPAIMVRRTRTAKLPTFVSQRKQTADKLFSAADISAASLVKTMAELPALHGKDADTEVKFTIDMRDKRNLPTIHWDVGGTTVVTDLAGSDITSQVEG